MRRYNLNNNSTSPTIRVVVLGDQDVGKSALVVRFLTKRFIGEYVSGQEITYQQEVNLSGNKVTAEICDAIVKNNPQNLTHLSTNTDAYLLVYSVCSRESFDFACQLAHQVKSIHGKASAEDDAPILLVGNKSDLSHFREVKKCEGEEFASSLSCHFTETSAAESYSDVEQAFRVVFQLARVHTRTSPAPAPSKNGRKNSITQQMAQLIRDHYRKGHLSHNVRTNSLERGLAMFKGNPSCDACSPLSPVLSAKRKGKKHFTAGFSQETVFPVSNGKQKLSAKCLSLGTLTEDSEENGSRNVQNEKQKMHVKAIKSEPAGCTDASNNNDRSCGSESGLAKMSMSSDEALESGDTSTTEDDAFSESGSTTPSPDSLPNQQFVSRNNKKLKSKAKRVSINRKNLQIDVNSAAQCDCTEPDTLSPKSAPVVHSISNQKFRYYPNGSHDNHSPLSNSNVPISPLLSQRNMHRIKSPKDEKKSPAQRFLKQFFKNTLHTSNNRSFGSNQNLHNALSPAFSDMFLNDDGSSTTVSTNENLSNPFNSGGPIYFHASSTSLSSVISNEDFDSVATNSAPTTPQVGKSRRKSRRTSVRDAVGVILRKRKQSVSIECFDHSNANKERVL